MANQCAVNGQHRGKCEIAVVRNAEQTVMAYACRKGMVALGAQHFHSSPKRSKKRCNVKEMSIPFRSRIS